MSSRLGQVFRLGQNGLFRAAAEPSPDHGDDAVGAAVVAALRNPQPGPVVRGADHPVGLGNGCVNVPKQRRVLPSEGLVNNLGQVLIAAHPHKAVGLGTALGQLVPPPLGHAASDQNLLQLTGLFLLHQLLNLRQGLLPGLLEKAAGVDHRHITARSA